MISGDNLEALATRVVDSGFRLHTQIGPGLLEQAYELILAKMLKAEGLKVERQVSLDVRIRDLHIPNAFRIDLFVEKCLIIEIKSVEQIKPVHSKQLLTYLRLAGLPLGLLFNFGAATFKENVKRVVNGHDQDFTPLTRQTK